ncbi:MAG: 2-oxoacid:acceptor oxidoreductase family protein [candidate division Zixibacteria bacterium]|nr:2-oxoacid:acceptor oxidoreductase family protein [candidate division Zixibacteria bacterium]HHE40750.1 pyruvate ferredoxin oxidoreductase [Candidatus Cloacimonadota bacterium]
MATTELRITGLGGQGVILTGYIIGKAASIFNNQHATLTQSFGPEARGSACSAQVIVSDDRVLYPYVANPYIMVAMSNEGYNKYKDTVTKNGIILYDSDLVQADSNHSNINTFGVPATRFAEELGRKIVLNIVMLGFFGAINEIIPKDALRKAVESSVPSGTEELNLKAFDKGFDFGAKLKKQNKVKA